MSFWDWASEVYPRPGVQEALLELQDGHGMSAPLLLWAAWTAVEGRSLDGPTLRRGVETAEGWDRASTSRLRQVRRALKAPKLGILDATREALREQVRAVELASEKVLMEALEALTPDITPPMTGGIAAALQAAAIASSRTAPPPLLQRLGALIEEDTAFRTETGFLIREGGRRDEAMDEELESEEAVRARINALKTEHLDLDASVSALMNSPLPDMIQIARLKKKKLTLRDQIAALEDRLTPDIIA